MGRLRSLTDWQWYGLRCSVEMGRVRQGQAPSPALFMHVINTVLWLVSWIWNIEPNLWLIQNTWTYLNIAGVGVSWRSTARCGKTTTMLVKGAAKTSGEQHPVWNTLQAEWLVCLAYLTLCISHCQCLHKRRRSPHRAALHVCTHADWASCV